MSFKEIGTAGFWGSNFQVLKMTHFMRDFHKFSCRNQLLHTKRPLIESLHSKIKENRWNHFWDIHFWANFWLWDSYFRFSDLYQNLITSFVHKIYSIKFGSSMIFRYEDTGVRIFPAHRERERESNF